MVEAEVEAQLRLVVRTVTATESYGLPTVRRVRCDSTLSQGWERTQEEQDGAPEMRESESEKRRF